MSSSLRKKKYFWHAFNYFIRIAHANQTNYLTISICHAAFLLPHNFFRCSIQKWAMTNETKYTFYNFIYSDQVCDEFFFALCLFVSSLKFRLKTSSFQHQFNVSWKRCIHFFLLLCWDKTKRRNENIIHKVITVKAKKRRRRKIE